MRVKKLSANRRHKPGEDDSAAADQRWVSPSKPAASSADSGGSSPTDPYSVHPVALRATAASPPRFQLDPAAFMAKNMAPQLLVPQDARAAFDKGGPLADWRARVDTALREAVHAKIVDILRALKPNAPDKVLERVPGLAYRMEESLFRMAQSEHEYRDLNTLPQRLALIQEASAKRLLQQQSSAAGSANGATTAAVAAAPRAALSEDQARVVFQCLQTWRQKLVNMYGVAPWEILPNQALAKVALYMPSTEQELAACGVDDGLVARFGSSLLQEVQQIYQVCSNASAKYASPAQGSSKASGRKAEGAKRPATDAAGSNSKRRKAASAGEFPNGNNASARLAPAPSLNFASSTASASTTPLLSSSQLFRPAGIDSLPTLLPSASVASAASAASKKAFGSNAGRLSPQGQVMHPPLFSRIDGDRQEQSHMHLLAQGAGQVSKQQQQQQQQEAASMEAYEKEIQTLRWMLHQSQQEKSQLEAEVQHLRQQLHGA